MNVIFLVASAVLLASAPAAADDATGEGGFSMQALGKGCKISEDLKHNPSVLLTELQRKLAILDEHRQLQDLLEATTNCTTGFQEAKEALSVILLQDERQLLDYYKTVAADVLKAAAAGAYRAGGMDEFVATDQFLTTGNDAASELVCLSKEAAGQKAATDLRHGEPLHDTDIEGCQMRLPQTSSKTTAQILQDSTLAAAQGVNQIYTLVAASARCPLTKVASGAYHKAGSGITTTAFALGSIAMTAQGANNAPTSQSLGLKAKTNGVYDGKENTALADALSLARSAQQALSGIKLKLSETLTDDSFDNNKNEQTIIQAMYPTKNAAADFPQGLPAEAKPRYDNVAKLYKNLKGKLQTMKTEGDFAAKLRKVYSSRPKCKENERKYQVQETQVLCDSKDKKECNKPCKWEGPDDKGTCKLDESKVTAQTNTAGAAGTGETPKEGAAATGCAKHGTKADCENDKTGDKHNCAWRKGKDNEEEA
uniref:Variant surface glycoprotein 1095 n=1 Tax=Trypanosoma brucei TaxID=5691 RepID=M4TAR7_9TRYP|nr:variant surface glycoprotein 1095 [Trypanosoma brucei]